MGQAGVKWVRYKNMRMFASNVGRMGTNETVMLNVIGALNMTPLATAYTITKEIVLVTKSISTATVKDVYEWKKSNVVQC